MLCGMGLDYKCEQDSKENQMKIITAKQSTIIDKKQIRQQHRKEMFKKIKKQRALFILMIPGLLYFILFKYVPMWGLIISFKNYQPILGFFGSEWVGFENYIDFFNSPDFFMILKNTLILSLMNIVFYFPMPIILALLLNEIGNDTYKRWIQTIVYIPHFISMVIVASLTYVLFTTDGGAVNILLENLFGVKINFLGSPDWFRPLIIGQTIWKETGYGTIIFLAALAGVDPTLYEAGSIDGANRFQLLRHITLPSIKNVIIILLILRMGRVLDNGFEQVFLMTNALNRSVGEVFNTFVYTVGITQGAFSYSTAVGLFKSIIGIFLVLGTNKIAKHYGHSGLY